MGNKQVTIGNRTVALEKQIGEGGQAFIYAVRDVSTGDRFALKRVCFREAAELSDIEREVSFHRRLGGHQHVVPLHGHTSHEPAGSSPGEVLMLMDFMPSNAEILCGRDPPESRILDVFSQVVEAVAFMHSQTPPIAHRDLKIENVLVSSDGVCKICDFGSATTATLEPDAGREATAKFEGDISRNTTLECRAPEMVDLHLRLPITEKVDVWALGCLLYRLCFGQTPFGSSSLRILTANYSIPESPVFSERVMRIISASLKVRPEERPDVFQLYAMACAARGTANLWTGVAKKRSLRPYPNVQSPPQSPSPSSASTSDPTSPPPLAQQRSSRTLWDALEPTASASPTSPSPVVVTVSSPPPSAQQQQGPAMATWDTLDAPAVPAAQPTSPPHTPEKRVPTTPSHIRQHSVPTYSTDGPSSPTIVGPPASARHRTRKPVLQSSASSGSLLSMSPGRPRSDSSPSNSPPSNTSGFFPGATAAAAAYSSDVTSATTDPQQQRVPSPSLATPPQPFTIPRPSTGDPPQHQLAQVSFSPGWQPQYAQYPLPQYPPQAQAQYPQHFQPFSVFPPQQLQPTQQFGFPPIPGIPAQQALPTPVPIVSQAASLAPPQSSPAKLRLSRGLEDVALAPPPASPRSRLKSSRS